MTYETGEFKQYGETTIIEIDTEDKPWKTDADLGRKDTWLSSFKQTEAETTLRISRRV